MIPYEQINVGDVFSDPMARGYGKYSGCEYHVTEKNDAERMVKVQAVSQSGKMIRSGFWKKNTDRMFAESWRVMSMRKMQSQ